jgi:hypothetical protein
MTASLRPLEPETDVIDHETALSEMRQLVADLRDAARDSRMLANRYADLLKSVVEEYCGEFELRAVAALARLEAAQ